MTTTELAPVRKTRFACRFTRRGQTASQECWGAETTDGIWDFEREDSPGTPWLAYHKPSVADGSVPMPAFMGGTLDQCRAMVASGAADAELAASRARFQAEMQRITGRMR